MNKDMIEIDNQTKKGEIKMKKMKHILKNEKGLTLIELLAVIVILGIVAAIAVPAIGNIIDNSKDKAILADAASILSGAKIAMTDGACNGSTSTPTTPDTCEETELAGYVDGISGATYKVIKNGNIWTVDYSKLVKIKNTTKFNVAAVANSHAAFTGGTSTTIDEKALNLALNK